MSDLDADVKIVGDHEFRFVPPCRVSFVMRGVFKEDDAIAYMAFLGTHADRCREPLEGLFDLSAVTAIDERARMRIVKRERPLPFRAVAIIGARFSIRTIATMILRAGKIIAPERFAFDIKFINSVEEANAWFDEVRNKRG